MIVLQFQSWNHCKSLWFPVTYIARVWGQQPYAACALDKQTIANNLSCSLYVLNTLPQKTMRFSLWAKFIQIILRVHVNLADTFDSTEGFQLTRSPSRHWDKNSGHDNATNPNFMHYCTGNHWRFPRNLLEILWSTQDGCHFFHDPLVVQKKKESPTSDAVSGAASITTWWCIKMTCIVGDVVSMSGLYVQLYIYVQCGISVQNEVETLQKKTIAETSHWRILQPFQVAYIWKKQEFHIHFLKQTWSVETNMIVELYQTAYSTLDFFMQQNPLLPLAWWKQ